MLTIWSAITVIAIIIEILTIDLVSVWFGAGSIVALIAYLLNASTTIQIILFVIVTVLCAVIIRPISKKYLRGNIEKTNFDRVIGKHGLVTKTITADNKGEVKVMSTLWMATSHDNTTICQGEYCEILAVEGAHLVVKKIKE